MKESKFDNFMFAHIGKVVVVFTFIFFIAVFTMVKSVRRDMEDCGGAAKCLGNQVKQFKEGMK